MSFKIVDEVIKTPGFKPNDKLVLMSLASHANDRDCAAWPSVETIGYEACLSRRTVQRSLRNLERMGVIKDVTPYFQPEPGNSRRRATKYGGNGNATEYRILVVTAQELAEILLKNWKERPTNALKSVRVAHQRASGLHGSASHSHLSASGLHETVSG